MPVASRSAPATPCPTGPAQFRETAVPGRYDQSPSNVSSANPPSRIPATGLFHATGALFFRPMKPPHVASGDSRRGPGSVNFSSSKKPPSIARRSRFTVELPQPIVLRFSSRPAEGDASMEVRCDKCQARYRVDDARIGPQGLSMRCGKCQNVFRVMPPGAAAAEAPQKPVPPAPKTLPRPNATAIFAAPPLPNSIPSPAKPPPQAAAAGRPPRSPAARVPPTSEEAAGRTMMFPTANLPSQPAAAKKAPVPSKPAAGGTMVFGESPAKSVPPPVPARGPKPAAKAADAARSTMMFGAPQPRIQAAPAAAVPTPEPAALAEPPASPEPALEEPSAIDGMPPPPSAGEADGPAAEAPAEAPPAAEGDEIAGEPGREAGT